MKKQLEQNQSSNLASYNQIVLENKFLKNKLSKIHYALGVYLKSINLTQAELIIGSEVAYKTDHTTLLPNFENNNVDYIISHHTR